MSYAAVLGPLHFNLRNRKASRARKEKPSISAHRWLATLARDIHYSPIIKLPTQSPAAAVCMCSLVNFTFIISTVRSLCYIHTREAADSCLQKPEMKMTDPATSIAHFSHSPSTRARKKRRRVYAHRASSSTYTYTLFPRCCSCDRAINRSLARSRYTFAISRSREPRLLATFFR